MNGTCESNIQFEESESLGRDREREGDRALLQFIYIWFGLVPARVRCTLATEFRDTNSISECMQFDLPKSDIFLYFNCLNNNKLVWWNLMEWLKSNRITSMPTRRRANTSNYVRSAAIERIAFWSFWWRRFNLTIDTREQNAHARL